MAEFSHLIVVTINDIKVNDIPVFISTLKRVSVFRPFKIMILTDKGLVLSCNLTFEYETRLFFAIQKFSGRILWTLHCTHVYPLRFKLLFDFDIGFSHNRGNLLVILWRTISLGLVLNLCLFFYIFSFILRHALNFGLWFGDLYVFVFDRLIFSVRAHTLVTRFGENFWIKARKVWGLRLRNQLLKTDESANIF